MPPKDCCGLNEPDDAPPRRNDACAEEHDKPPRRRPARWTVDLSHGDDQLLSEQGVLVDELRSTANDVDESTEDEPEHIGVFATSGSSRCSARRWPSTRRSELFCSSGTAILAGSRSLLDVLDHFELELEAWTRDDLRALVSAFDGLGGVLPHAAAVRVQAREMILAQRRGADSMTHEPALN